MKKLITISVIILCFLSFSQEKRMSFEEKQKMKEDSIVQSIQNELKQKGVTEYFYFKKVLGGSMNIHIYEDGFEKSSFDKKYEYYFFWKENKECFIRKFENENNYGIKTSVYIPNKIRCFNLFSLSEKDVKTLETEIVKPPEYEVEGEIEERAISQPTDVIFTFIKNKKIFTNKFESFSLIEKHFDNINHKHNQSLKIVQLYNKCEEIISELEDKNLFVIQD